jgi:3-methyladenine DNA glycosylase/8-oxoguanine DNA glycosylase
MWKTKYLNVPDGFSFERTVQSHGWYDLAPFKIEEDPVKLRYVFRDQRSGRIVCGTFSFENSQIRIELDHAVSDKSSIEDDARHILRLDDDVDDFYHLIEPHDNFSWVRTMGAGRLLRSPTVFEDLVKTLCTTNCSWGLTKKMVSNLVQTVGEPGLTAKRAFPTAAAMAEKDEKFYRDVIKGGYRSPFFVELAENVASGKIDPEAWLTSELPTLELRKEIKSIKGIGDYAADNLLKLLGRYDGLALDSWLRAQFYKKHNRNKPCPDKKIERRYARFGKWKGLVLWCDMTEYWHTSGR